MDNHGSAGYRAGVGQPYVRRGETGRQGFIVLCVLAACLSILAEWVVVGILFQRALFFVTGARAYRSAVPAVEQVVWQAKQGELALAGETTAEDGLRLVWRQEPCADTEDWRLCITASKMLMGRNWSTTWTVYR